MKHAKPIGTVTTPRTPREGIALLPWCQDVNRAIQQLRDRAISVSGISRQSSSADLPFSVALEVGGTPEARTYSVTVSDGWINERIPGVGEIASGETEPPSCTAMHKPHNILWGADGAEQEPAKLATDRRSFPITIGQQVSVVVFVNAEGNIAVPEPEGEEEPEPGPVKIAVEDRETSPEADKRSLHYVPPRPVDSDTGSAGEYHYKLAILRDASEGHPKPWLETFLAGSHLDHFAELPILDNSAAAGTDKGRVFWKYDPETNTYLFRAIDTSEGELEVTESEGGLGLRGNSYDADLQISVDGGSAATLATVVDGLITSSTVVNIETGDPFPGGLNLNLEIYGTNFYDAGGGLWSITRGSTPEAILYWRNGLYVGDADPDGGTPPVLLDVHQIDQNLGL